MSTYPRISAAARALRDLPQRKTIAAAAGAMAIALGVTAYAADGAMGPAHHFAAMHAKGDMAGHLDQMQAHLYALVGATDAQKAQLDPVLKQAAADLAAIHAQAGASHGQMAALLTQDTIDRAALENLRVAHIQAADQASKRMVQMVADVADVLTPAQRKAFAEHIAQHFAGMHQ